MAAFRARQIETIRNAVGEGRAAVRAAGRFEPAVFAEAFVAAGGVQIPGAPDDEQRRREVAEALLEALRRGRRRSDDRDVQREIDRAHNEVQWARAQLDDKIVGFYAHFPEGALESPEVETLSHAMHGYSAGVFRKSDVVVLQPVCDGTRFTPVLEDEVES